MFVPNKSLQDSSSLSSDSIVLEKRYKMSEFMGTCDSFLEPLLQSGAVLSSQSPSPSPMLMWLMLPQQIQPGSAAVVYPLSVSSLWKLIQNTFVFCSARRFSGDTGQNSTQTTSTLSPFGRTSGTNGRVTSSLPSALLYPPAATTNALTVYLQTLHQQPAPLLDII